MDKDHLPDYDTRDQEGKVDLDFVMKMKRQFGTMSVQEFGNAQKLLADYLNEGICEGGNHIWDCQKCGKVFENFVFLYEVLNHLWSCNG